MILTIMQRNDRDGDKQIFGFEPNNGVVLFERDKDRLEQTRALLSEALAYVEQVIESRVHSQARD